MYLSIFGSLFLSSYTKKNGFTREMHSLSTLFVPEIVSKARETSQHTLKIKFNKTD